MLDYKKIIEDKAKLFSDNLGMPQSSEQIKKLLISNDLKSDFALVKETIKKEFGNIPYRKNMIDILFGYVDEASQKNLEQVKKVWPLESTHNWAEMLPDILTMRYRIQNFLISNAKKEPKDSPIGVCLDYLCICEGLYKNSMREILVWQKLSKNEEIENLFQSSLGKITNMLKNTDAKIFFEGYNSHVRNAIAHMTFKINSDNLEFRDYRPNLSDVNIILKTQDDLIDDIEKLTSVHIAVFLNRQYHLILTPIP